MSDFKGAKRHAILKTLSAELSKGFIEDMVKVGNHTYKIATLNEDEESWADSFIRTSSPASIYSSRKAPRLAAAIKAIDDVPIAELFMYPDDMKEDVRAQLNENPVQKQFWLRNEMLLYLSDEGNRPWINELYTALSKLDDKRDEATKQVKNS
jgi:DNA topoisomerase IB